MDDQFSQYLQMQGQQTPTPVPNPAPTDPTGMYTQWLQKQQSASPAPMPAPTPTLAPPPAATPDAKPFFSWPSTTESNPFIGNLPSDPTNPRETQQALADQTGARDLGSLFGEGANSTKTMANPSDKLVAEMDNAKTKDLENNASSQTPTEANAVESTKHATSGATGSHTGNKLELNVPSDSNKENIRDAQNRAAYSELVNRLGKAGEIIGTGLSRQPLIGQAGFDEQIKGAQDIVKNYKARLEDAKNDPNSPESQAAKQLMSRAGINVKGDFTAAMFDKYAGFAQKAQEGEANRQARLMQYKMHTDYMNQAKQSLADQHLQAAFEGRGAPPDVSRDLQIQGDINTINDLKAKGAGNWTMGDKTTFLTAYRQLLAKSSRAVGGNNAGDYIPTTMLGNIQEKMNNLTNQADPIHVANLAQPLLDTADHIGQQANKRIADYQANTYHAFKGALSPESRTFYENRLNKGGQGQGQHLQIDNSALSQAKVQHFMKQNPSVTDPTQAYQILKDHGQL